MSDNCCASLSASLSPAVETVAIPHWKVGLKSSKEELTFSDEQLDCSFNNLWVPAVMPWLAPGCLCISLFKNRSQRCGEGNVSRLHTDIMLTCWLSTSSNTESLIVKGIKNNWLEQPITVHHQFVLPAELKNTFPIKTLMHFIDQVINNLNERYRRLWSRQDFSSVQIRRLAMLSLWSIP